MILYKLHTDQEEVLGILKLQKSNIEDALSPEEARKEGFVTVKHQMDDLNKICGPYGHTIAKDGNTVIGYAITMLPDYSEKISVLKPMFDILHGLKWKENNLTNYEYIAMGQICIDKDYRGKGIFSGLYSYMQRSFSNRYSFVITEIATRNIRSLKAHQHIDFQVIHQFSDTTDDWNIVLWDWGINKME